jgi:hypothetical protein
MRLYGPSSASVSGGEVEPFLPRMTKTRLIRSLWYDSVVASGPSGI